MKKCLALVLALCLLFSLCGCEALSLAENVQPYFTGAEFKESEQYYKNYYYPMPDFKEATKDIFRPNTGYGADQVNTPLYIVGTVEKTTLLDGVRYYILNTEYGTIYISNGLFTLAKIEDGTKVQMYFVYLGNNKTIGTLTGAYVDYRLTQ
ncbi:MAG: hypothetical protein II727_10710 [Oscillospiraceae bacterium]|nr:hypothetical protein [Oscillospiraceae bacterium]